MSIVIIYYYEAILRYVWSLTLALLLLPLITEPISSPQANRTTPVHKRYLYTSHMLIPDKNFCNVYDQPFSNEAYKYYVTTVRIAEIWEIFQFIVRQREYMQD